MNRSCMGKPRDVKSEEKGVDGQCRAQYNGYHGEDCQYFREMAARSVVIVIHDLYLVNRENTVFAAK